MADPTARTTILVVDDTPDNLTLITSLLKPDYQIKIANRGHKALEIAASEPSPDLILLDVMMPEMDGYEVCRRLKDDDHTRDIPVIFLTALDQDEDEEYGLGLGAVDFISKPIRPSILLARVRTHLRLKEANEFLRNQNAILEQKVVERTWQLAVVQDVTMLAMGSLAETRDNETGNHIRRTQHYIKALASTLARRSRYRDALTPETIEILYKSAPLHDIGKVGVPDNILLKPGKLTDDEFEIMKRHAMYGYEAIMTAEGKLGEPDSFLRHAREIAAGHHERWDGNGYPGKLAEEDIPVSARLMAVADVYDALISRRVYKPPMPHDEAVEIILDGRGGHFDPNVVDAFVEIVDEFDMIAARFVDTESEMGDENE